MNLNFIFNIGLVGISAKKANLWGNQDHPVFIFSFLVFTVIVFKTNVIFSFWKAVNDSQNLDDVWVRLAPSIRIARKKAEAKARGEYMSYKESALNRYQTENSKLTQTNNAQLRRIDELEKTVKTLARLK